jgi:hypothetical protein
MRDDENEFVFSPDDHWERFELYTASSPNSFSMNAYQRSGDCEGSAWLHIDARRSNDVAEFERFVGVLNGALAALKGGGEER